MPSPSPFTRQQRTRISQFYQELADVVRQYDPNFTGRTTELKEWKYNKAEELLQEDLFKTLDTNSLTLKEWADLIVRIYTNHLNNTIKKKALKGGGTQRQVFPLAILSGTISPRQLFIYENQETIKTKYLEICALTGKPGGAARHQAVKMLWDDVDQDEWKKRAERIKNDTSSNQAEFASAVEDSLDRLVGGGLLGSCAVTLMYAFRDEDDVMRTGQVHAAYNVHSKSTLVHKFGDDLVSVNRWISHAQDLLPRKPIELETEFVRDKNGRPVFPKVDTRRTPPDDIAVILRDYFLAMWSYTQGSVEFPWEDIEVHPDNYYDSWAFPGKIAAPNTMDVIDIVNIAHHLAKNTFTFFSKEHVQQPIKLTQSLYNRNLPCEKYQEPQAALVSDDDEQEPARFRRKRSRVIRSRSRSHSHSRSRSRSQSQLSSRCTPGTSNKRARTLPLETDERETGSPDAQSKIFGTNPVMSESQPPILVSSDSTEAPTTESLELRIEGNNNGHTPSSVAQNSTEVISAKPAPAETMVPSPDSEEPQYNDLHAKGCAPALHNEAAETGDLSAMTSPPKKRGRGRPKKMDTDSVAGSKISE